MPPKRRRTRKHTVSTSIANTHDDDDFAFDENPSKKRPKRIPKSVKKLQSQSQPNASCIFTSSNAPSSNLRTRLRVSNGVQDNTKKHVDKDCNSPSTTTIQMEPNSQNSATNGSDLVIKLLTTIISLEISMLISGLYAHFDTLGFRY